MTTGITLAQAQAALANWLAADVAVARNQRYRIDTGAGYRELFRADAVEIRNNIQYWDAKVKALTPAAAGGKRRIRYLVPE